jgi:hypothetical protein
MDFVYADHLQSSQRVVAWGSSSRDSTGTRVEEEDRQMKIGPWVARKRKAFWQARFPVAVAMPG